MSLFRNGLLLASKFRRCIKNGMYLAWTIAARRMERNLSPMWSPELRFIEFGCRDAAIARMLTERGFVRYLGLKPRSCAGETDESSLFADYSSPTTISNNNADVIILSGTAARHLWDVSMYRHATFVVWSIRWDLDTLAGFCGWLNQVLRGNVALKGLVTFKNAGNRRQRLVISRVCWRRYPRGARRYLSPLVGVDGFNEVLANRGVQYVVLRWFDGLPHVKEGEDLDLLVRDRDIETLEGIFTEQPGILPCDVYTVSGLPGSDYQEMAYYPPYLATQILDRAIRHRSGYRVPCSEDHFLSLAYHAVYHKGGSSGLDSETQGVSSIAEPEHDYAGVLASLAAELGWEVHPSLEGLDRLLQARGWRPPRDTLERLAAGNEWVAKRFFSGRGVKEGSRLTGLATFVLRERVIERGLLDDVLRILESEGFETVSTRLLSKEESERVAHRMRGANWGRGPFPTSAGGPAMLVVALDYFPSPADPRTQKTHPHLTNQKVLTAKRRIRDFVNSRLQPDQRCNAIHSSDNEEGALEYIRLAMPEEKEFICSKVESLATLIESRHTVRARFSTGGRRAKVELVEYDSRLAVKKTYRPGCERFLERELLMMRKIGVELSEVPELIEAGSNYFICPNYDDVLRYDPNSRRLLPLKVVRQAFGFLKQVYDRGYSLIDFSPENLLVDRESGLKVIDFEFLYKYDVLPGDFSRCYELAGIPENFSADLPKAYYLHAPYEYLWRWRVGLTYSSLLNDPLWLQHLKRTAFRFRSALPFNAGKLYRSVLAWRRRRLAQ